MKWWHWIFIVLLIGVVGIFGSILWRRRLTLEEFQSTSDEMSKWNGLYLLQSNIYDSGSSQYTIFDMERVEIQRKILEYEFGLFRQKIWEHEKGYINYVLTRNTDKDVFSRFINNDKIYGLTGNTLTSDQRQILRILFSYIYKFSGESYFEFAYRGYTRFDEPNNDTVNLKIKYQPTDSNEARDVRNYSFELTGLDFYLNDTILKDIQKEYNFDELKHPLGFILSGKKSEAIRYPPASAPVVYTGLHSLILPAAINMDKQSIFKSIWVCPSTPMFGKGAARIVDKFLADWGDGYFVTLCSYYPDRPSYNRSYDKNKASGSDPNRRIDQEFIREELVGGQVVVRGYSNKYLLGYGDRGMIRLYRDETPLNIARVPDTNLVGYRITYPDQFKEKAFISTSILSNPTNWNGTGLPTSIFKYNELNVSPSYVDTLITNFANSKDNQQAKYPWKGVRVNGTISSTNKDEITKSVSICVALNFSDLTTIDKQLRVKKENTKLYMSQNYSGQTEFQNKIERGTDGVMRLILYQDDAAVANNNTNCNIEVTGEMLKLIPYHARRFIATWGDSRAERIAKYQQQGASLSTFDSTVKTVTNLIQKPIFDLASARDLTTTGDNSLLTTEKQAILNAMAQLYYDLNTDGSTRIKMFHDVFQVGETLFDARYEVQTKISTDVQLAIKRLTDEYESIRNTALTVDEVNRLELTYQQKVNDLYAQEEQNQANTGTNCGPKAKYIRIAKATADAAKRISLSQVQASSNEGANVARYGLVTPVSMNSVLLFPGEDVSGQQYGFDGRPLPTDKNTQLITARNNATRASKPPLLTDGIVRPRTVPNYYESTSTSADDYIEINIGSESEITSVRLIFPQIIEDTTATALTITLYDSDRKRVQQTDITLSRTDATNRVATASFFYTLADAKCARSLANTYRVARFYASIRDTGLGTDGRPDITKLSFTGFTESTDIFETAALTFNPLYNCGFDLPLDDPGGGQLFMPTIKYTKNFRNTTLANIDCTSADTVKSIMAEYRLTQRAQGFDTRADIRALTGDQAYNLTKNDYIPSSVTAYAQINVSTCAFQFQEIVNDRVTNQPSNPVIRHGTFVMTPDTQNWYSQKLTYNVADSRMYQSLAAYNAAMPSNPLTAFTSPVAIPIPFVSRVALDNGKGACPTPKYCSDTDMINQLVTKYNTTTTTPILRVNRAVSGGGLDGESKRCDYEAVFGNYATGGNTDTPQTTFTGTISMTTKVNPLCEYELVSASQIGEGYFADSNQPLLTKIYTYASEVIAPYMNDLTAAVSALMTAGQAQTMDSGSNITTGLRTYRSDVLASYASLKGLEGCAGTDPIVRCGDSAILQAFLENYQQNNTDPEFLTKILRGGTASGSECDFTYETSSGNTRGARCKMVKADNYCSFSFDSNYRPPEVYSVVGTGFTYEEAYGTCQTLGAELATTNQLAHALRTGADWCGNRGWVLDTDPDGNPMMKSPCAATSNLSEVKATKTDRAAINCYGVKPASTDSNTPVGRVLPFNGTGATTWFQPVQQFLQGCMKMMPMPPTMDDLADSGYQPITTSPLASQTLTTKDTNPIVPVVPDAAVSPRDFIDCRSAYAISSADQRDPTAFAPFYTAATQTVLAEDAATCLYNRSIRVNFSKTNGVYVANSVTRLATALPAATNETALTPNVNTRPTVPTVAIATDTDCASAAFLNATGMRSRIVASKRLDATTCEYRVTTQDKLPFGDTFKRAQFAGGNAQPFLTSITNSVENGSMFRFFPDLAGTSGVQNAATQTALVKILKDFWNPKYYDEVIPTPTIFKKRIGNASKIGYSAATDTVFIIARYAEYGILGDLDIRSYNETQCFSIVYRKPAASFFTTALDTAFIYSVNLLPTVPAGVTLYTVSDTTGPTVEPTAVVLPARSNFRMMRFRINSPAAAELYRLNFYTVTGTPPATYVCSTNPAPTDPVQPITLTRTYVTVVDSDGKELRMPSYLPAAGTVCDPEYNTVTDAVSQLPVCQLDYTKLKTVDRPLYEYTKAAKPCQIGYTEIQTPAPAKCKINYNMNDLLQPYCYSSASTDSSRLELKANQWVIVYLYDTYAIDGYSITTGTNTKIPQQWELEGSLNGVQWAPLHKQSVNYTFTDSTANPAGQFVTSQIFRWKPGANTPIATGPIMTRPQATTIEPFVSKPAVPTVPAGVGERRPSWFRIRAIRPRVATSKFVQISGPLLFLTPSGYIDPKQIQVSNFGGSRRNPKEGPDALLDTVSAHRRWVDYAGAPLLFRLPEKREAIRGFRFSLPGIDVDAYPSAWILEGSWDGKVWEPVLETTRLPDNSTQDHRTVVRFEEPF
jgi:hypothetical protein